jgi:hypothetical protein
LIIVVSSFINFVGLLSYYVDAVENKGFIPR